MGCPVIFLLYFIRMQFNVQPDLQGTKQYSQCIFNVNWNECFIIYTRAYLEQLESSVPQDRS